jgi:hypothetical protein
MMTVDLQHSLPYTNFVRPQVDEEEDVMESRSAIALPNLSQVIQTCRTHSGLFKCVPLANYTDDFAQSLAQQLIIELQVSAQLHTRPSFPPTASIEDDANATDYDKDCDDDDDDDDHDDDDVDEDIDDGPFHHTDDRSESTKIFCPHPKCKDKPPYTKKANLQRHYTNRMLCFQFSNKPSRVIF